MYSDIGFRKKARSQGIISRIHIHASLRGFESKRITYPIPHSLLFVCY